MIVNFIFLVVVWDVRRRLGKLANHKPEASDVQAFPHVNSPEYPSWVYYVANPKENVVYFLYNPRCVHQKPAPSS